MSVFDRNYREKHCKICGKPFQPAHPATACCSEECREIAYEKMRKDYYNRVKQSKPKSNKPKPKCEICGKAVTHFNGKAHEKCMLKEFLTNHETLRKDKRYVAFMNNHFATTNYGILHDIARETYGMCIEFKYIPLVTDAKPILCVETGKVYPSINQASKECYISSSSLSAALHGRAKTSGGYHWEFLRK